MAQLYLESWLHKIIAMNLSQQITRADVETYRDFNLQRTIQYAYEKSAFYRELFDQHRLTPADILGFDDLVKLPFTESRHLSQFPYRFMCTSQSDVVRPCIFVTSGTTGPKKQVFWTQGDLERITDFMSAGIGTVATRKDTVQILLFDGNPNSQADLLCQGVRKLGARPVVSGADKSAREQLEILDNSKSTILFGYTGQLYRITKELQPYHNLRSRKVKVLFLAGEYLPDARRRELETIWNCRVHTHYGLTEMGLGVAVECNARNGYHFNEADLILEIINPATGKCVKPGEEGEMVFTTLTREAMPLIRYRTHDLSRFIDTPCSCGANSLLKFDAVKKRLESMAPLGNGMLLYPSLFDDLLFEIPDVIDYQVALLRYKNKDRLDFTIEVTHERKDVLGEIDQRLQSTPVVSENILAGNMSVPVIKLVPMNNLKTADRAKKILIDGR